MEDDIRLHKSPAFQFYPKDFLTDGKQIRMSLAECGAYTRLLCQCWLEGSLPADLKQLARICGATNRQMKEMWPNLAPCFVEQDHALTHPRLDREREKQALFRRRQSEKGKASAHMREVLAANRRATGPQPESNRGSTAVQPDPQPESNSPISYLLPPGTVSKEQKQAPDKAPSPAKEFLSWFQTEYKARRHGAAYFVTWDKHMPIIGRLLKLHAPDRLRKHAQLLLTTDEPWTETTDRGIEVLASKINWLDERLSRWEASRKAREAV